MSTSRTTRIVEVYVDELHDKLDRATRSPLNEADCELFKDLVLSYAHLTELVDEKTTTIEQLRKLFGRSRSEKTKDVLGKEGGTGEKPDPDAAGSAGDGPDANEGTERKTRKRKGHGRNGQAAGAT